VVARGVKNKRTGVDVVGVSCRANANEAEGDAISATDVTKEHDRVSMLLPPIDRIDSVHFDG
jgi:hypothetical protein